MLPRLGTGWTTAIPASSVAMHGQATTLASASPLCGCVRAHRGYCRLRLDSLRSCKPDHRFSNARAAQRGKRAEDDTLTGGETVAARIELASRRLRQ